MRCRTFGVLAIALIVMTAPVRAAPVDDPLPLVKAAANVVENALQKDLSGFLAIFIGATDWREALKDQQMGPLLKLRDPKSSRSAVLFFNPEQSYGAAVFFDGSSPVGLAAGDAPAFSSPYKRVTADMQGPDDKGLAFRAEAANSDTGAQLKAYVISINR